MLSVIIPTEGVEQTAVATLAALVPGAAAGIVREVLLVDGTRNGVIERVAPRVVPPARDGASSALPTSQAAVSSASRGHRRAPRSPPARCRLVRPG